MLSNRRHDEKATIIAVSQLSRNVENRTDSRFVETMLTVIETCRQQRRSAFDYLTASIHSHLARQPASSLLSGV